MLIVLRLLFIYSFLWKQLKYPLAESCHVTWRIHCLKKAGNDYMTMKWNEKLSTICSRIGIEIYIGSPSPILISSREWLSEIGKWRGYSGCSVGEDPLSHWGVDIRTGTIILLIQWICRDPSNRVGGDAKRRFSQKINRC